MTDERVRPWRVCPTDGAVKLGDHGVGGMHWNATAALFLDFWFTGVPAAAATSMAPLHQQYADATGHAPMLRDEAMLFWQSRNRYDAIAASIAPAIVFHRYRRDALRPGRHRPCLRAEHRLSRSLLSVSPPRSLLSVSALRSRSLSPLSAHALRACVRRARARPATSRLRSRPQSPRSTRSAASL